MWKNLPKKGQAEYLQKWIKKISKNETGLSIKRHIVRHAKEIYQRNPKYWSASMKNLVEIFDRMHKIKPGVRLRLERLENKYKSDKKRYTTPPKI